MSPFYATNRPDQVSLEGDIPLGNSGKSLSGSMPANLDSYDSLYKKIYPINQ